MPEVGFFELYPAARPLLPAGTYIMAADHDLTATPPNNADGTLAVDGTDFTVKIQSPRFVMPPNQILSTFPPNAAVGDWRQRFPQIVFKRRTLPWERDPDTKDPKFGFAAEVRPPYLALVVLAEGEGTLSKEMPIAQCVTAGTPLLDDSDTAVGHYLEVRQSIVDKVFPTVADLSLLAHVRKVNLEDTELALGDDDGYLAVVVANRLPQPGLPESDGAPVPPKRYTAYLLNVEGQLHALPTNVQTEPDFLLDMPELLLSGLVAATAPADRPVDMIVMQPKALGALLPKARVASADAVIERASASVAGPAAAASAYAVGPISAVAASADDSAVARAWVETGRFASGVIDGIIEYLDPTLRFPVLTSWDFVCTDTGTFESLMFGLDSGMLGTEDEHLDPALRPDITDTGHIGLDHTTRRGEATTAWYRGPFVPQPTVRAQPAPDGSLDLPHTGDQLRRVVPDGHEDLSLASAFEIGRLLALSKPGVVAALARWRAELFGAARLQQYAATYVDDLIAGFATAAVETPRALDDLVARQIIGRYSEQVRSSMPTVASFAAARLPDTMADVDPDGVVAGLGLDARVVRRAVRTEGLAAFASFDAATVEPTTKPLSSQPEQLGLVGRGLMAHVEQLVDQAIPVVPKGRRRRVDALDRLIDEASTAPGAPPPAPPTTKRGRS